MSFSAELPAWLNEGSAPSVEKMQDGWAAREKPPAGWFNWHWNRTYLALKELQEKAAEKADLEAIGGIPERYNVKGDGVANDLPGLKQFITDRKAAGASVVVLPDGEYKIDSQLLVPTGIILIASGRNCVIRATFNNAAPVKFLDGVRVGLIDVIVSGPSGSRIAASQGAVTFHNCTDFVASGVRVETSAAVGIFITGSTRGIVEKCRIRGTEADGIHHTGGSMDIITMDNETEGTGDDSISVVSYQSQPQPCRRIIIANNRVKDAGARGITHVGGDVIMIVNNTVNGSRSSGIMLHKDGTYNTYAPVNTLVSGNTIERVGDFPAEELEGNQIGMEIDGAEFATIRDNTVTGASQRGFVIVGSKDLDLIDNKAYQNKIAGFVVGGAGVMMRGNRAVENGEQGFLINGLAYSEIADMYARNNGTKFVTAGGTKYDNIFVTNSQDLILDNFVTIDDRATIALDRGIEINGCARIKIGKYIINVGTQSRPIFSATNTDIEMEPFTQNAAPTTATFPAGLFRPGQIIHHVATGASVGTSYIWDGSVWNALADVSDVAAAQNTLQTAINAKMDANRPSNLLPNSSGQIGLTGWTIRAGAGWAAGNGIGPAPGEFFQTAATPTNADAYIESQSFKVQAGQTYNFSVEFYNPEQVAGYAFAHLAYSNGTNATFLLAGAGDTWTRRNMDIVIPAGVTSATVRLAAKMNIPAGQRGFRRAQVTQGTGVQPWNNDADARALFQYSNDRAVAIRDAIVGQKGTVTDSNGDGIYSSDELIAGVNSIIPGNTLTGIRTATGVGLWGDRGLAVYPEKGYQKGGPGDGEIKVLTTQMAAAEPNLVPSKIAKGVNIFGVVGTGGITLAASNSVKLADIKTPQIYVDKDYGTGNNSPLPYSSTTTSKNFRIPYSGTVKLQVDAYRLGDFPDYYYSNLRIYKNSSLIYNERVGNSLPEVSLSVQADDVIRAEIYFYKFGALGGVDAVVRGFRFLYDIYGVDAGSVY